MTAVMHLDADLTFDVEVLPDGDQPAARLRATLTASGNQVVLHSEDILSVAGQPSRTAVRHLAAELARLGLAVEVSGPDGVIVRLGAVRSPVLHRLVTRSRHIRLGSWTRALSAVIARQRPAGRSTRLVVAGMPPGTPWPPLPTVRGLPRVVTTTHDPAGGGHPRLYLSDLSDPQQPRLVGMFPLSPDGTTIGSADGVDLQLAGTDDLQAEIVRTDEDEYVLIARSRRILSTVGGQQLPRQVLRTGARIELGPWRMSYVRDEFADHGRPYGGRVGGELGRQRTQAQPDNRTGPSF